MTLLQVKHLTKSFAGKTVVDDVSFTLEPLTATALIGPNGAGKTTTMSMIVGLLQQTNGTVTMQGVQDIRQSIGFLPQYPQFYPWLSALEYVEMVGKLSGVQGKSIREKSIKMLEYVGLGDALHKKTATFSGGMKQRLGIAQAIIHDPKLLLLDEPVSALDPIGRQEVMNLLKELQQQTTILYSTHILHDAEKMTDQVLFLKNGQLVEQGSLAAIQQKYADPKYLIQFVEEQGAASFAARYAGQQDGLSVYLPAQQSMQQVLQLLATEQQEIVKVERVTASLDEIFMKVAYQ
ncbi:ABC transporter ATP-binding protein [Metasolibacillus meyeri]|uniref:ABC transporter ATP-binding protein n=1 Tax=Metasolibacillus meyeri TaxID=1071052 RepID=A0AAW9NVB7_9BACL|nr:ABC transporter ATP-binding protein [Metasolibacillus meyeri]MEC1179146.1 ABC transporter ATP-binding protein [Metasolibacillus meyeri]